MAKKDIQEIYPLSPMQEGMLFHDIFDSRSTAYFEQVTIRVSGVLEIEPAREAFNALIKRYDILRTMIVYENVERPLNVVLKERKGELFYRDLTNWTASEQEGIIEQFKVNDRKRGFHLTKEMLMRIAIFRTEQEAYQIIWSFHHILMDGWCLGIIVNDFNQLYLRIKENLQISLPVVYPYSRYINWLQKQGVKNAQSYWQDYLTGYTEMAGLPGEKTGVGVDYLARKFEFSIPEELTGQLMELASQYQVTMNIVCQVLWGVLLQKYNNTTDVVFGAVTSGRSADLPGIEQMVGLFINTVPVRIRGNGRFGKLLQEAQLAWLESEKYGYYSLAEIQNGTVLKHNLFDHIVAFENFPWEEELIDPGVGSARPFTIVDV
jgi:hypothetical protein